MKRVLSIILFILLLSGCRNTQIPSQERSLAEIYNPSRSNVHPDFVIHHINDSNSVAYIRIFPSELLFNQANERAEFTANMTISFIIRELNNAGEDGEISDSASIRRSLNRNDARNSYFTALPLKALKGKKYSLEITIRDEKRGSKSFNYLIIDKTSPYNHQNFRVLSVKTGYPTFKYNFSSDESFKISYNQMGYDSIYVDYYAPDRTLPRPVFSTAPEIPLKTYPDSIWRIPLSDSFNYHLPLPGIYHLRVTLDQKEGLSLFNFGENFPSATNPDELLGPLIYLTSSAEFRDLRMEPNRKLAIDDFWLSLNSSMPDAKELIRVYYNRVLFSNLYFSSFKEGWKTDRGMIYIIFGAPDMLEKTSKMEKWTYYVKKNASPVEFIFDRGENLFTNQDFRLRRGMSSTSLWADAVRTWRRGKIYSPKV